MGDPHGSFTAKKKTRGIRRERRVGGFFFILVSQRTMITKKKWDAGNFGCLLKQNTMVNYILLLLISIVLLACMTIEETVSMFILTKEKTIDQVSISHRGGKRGGGGYCFFFLFLWWFCFVLSFFFLGRWQSHVCQHPYLPLHLIVQTVLKSEATHLKKLSIWGGNFCATWGGMLSWLWV